MTGHSFDEKYFDREKKKTKLTTKSKIKDKMAKDYDCSRFCIDDEEDDPLSDIHRNSGMQMNAMTVFILKCTRLFA